MNLPDPDQLGRDSIAYELEVRGDGIAQVWMHNLHGQYWDRQTVINGETFDQALERHGRPQL